MRTCPVLDSIDSMLFSGKSLYCCHSLMGLVCISGLAGLQIRGKLFGRINLTSAKNQRSFHALCGVVVFQDSCPEPRSPRLQHPKPSTSQVYNSVKALNRPPKRQIVLGGEAEAGHGTLSMRW